MFRNKRCPRNQMYLFKSIRQLLVILLCLISIVFGLFSVFLSFQGAIAKLAKSPNKYSLTKSLLNNNISNESYQTLQRKGLLINVLTRMLQDRLTAFASNEVGDTILTCDTNASIGNTCLYAGCLRLKMPLLARERVEQIISPLFVQLLPEVKKSLQKMADNISGFFDIIIVSALSSNHFLEAQAMLQNVHEYVFPNVNNFTFIVYNLGLTLNERKLMTNTCKCHLIDFPFHEFPIFISYLKCYTWKTIIINAHINRANTLIWIDTSIRFLKDPQPFLKILKETKLRGIQLGSGKNLLPHHTLAEMFHYFGDEPCVYYPYQEGMSGCIFISNDFLVKKVILEPWIICALNKTCMCPVDIAELELIVKSTTCRTRKGPYHYGVCHRFDQSALSILIAKLYQQYYRLIVRNFTDFWEVKRGSVINYTQSINKQA